VEGHTGDDDAWLGAQSSAQPQGEMAVQQLMPPALDYHLGHHMVKVSSGCWPWRVWMYCISIAKPLGLLVIGAQVHGQRRLA
jgi:hypothetical protein